MHIAINCRSFLKKQYTGIGRYTYHLIQSLREIDSENQYSLYVRKGLFDRKKHIPSIQTRNFANRVDWFNRGTAKTLKNVDVYHSPSPDFIDVPGAKVVVTVHDLIYKAYPQGHTQQTIDLTDQQMKKIAVQADRIICCSNSTMSDLKKYFEVGSRKIHRVYPGVDQSIFYPVQAGQEEQAKNILKANGITDRYILFVGTIEPRKNLSNLLKAFALLKQRKKFNGKLVAVGMSGWMNEGLEDLIRELQIKEDVIFPGFLSNEALRIFYNHAEVFVFPSFYEGFGFPIVEAFSCAAAVVTSNISSCPEIAQDAALTVDPNNVDAIAQAIIKIVEDPAFKKGLIQKGLKRAQEFSFSRMAEQTLAVYNEVYSP